MVKTIRVNTAVINIPTKVGPENWIECWELTAEVADVFGVNENSKKKHKVYFDLAKKHNHGRYGVSNTPNPIFWDRKIYRGISGRQVRLHKAATGPLARKFPGFNAARYATEVVLRHRETKQELAFIVTHWVPNGNKVNPVFRTASRIASKRGVTRLIRENRNEGRPTFLMGDTNIFKKFWLYAIRWLRSQGIDKLGFAVPSGWKVSNMSSSTYPAPTDHKHGVRGSVTLTK